MAAQQALSIRLAGPFGFSASDAVSWGVAVGFAVFVAGLLAAGLGRIVKPLFPVAAVLVGAVLYLWHPSLYLGFTCWRWFLTPEVRRIVDYQTGWTSISPVMIAPYLVGGVVALMLLRRLPRVLQRFFIRFSSREVVDMNCSIQRFAGRHHMGPVAVALATPLLVHSASATETATARLMVEGLDLPSNVAAAPAGSGRLFVTEQHRGTVRVIDDGRLLQQPFLSIDDRLEETPGSEAGLLRMAFPPDFPVVKQIFVTYTGRHHALRLSRFAVSALEDRKPSYSLFPIGRFANTARVASCISASATWINIVTQAASLRTSTGQKASLLRLESDSGNIRTEIMT